MPIKKEVTKKDKDDNDKMAIKFIDSFRFMLSSFSNLVHNLSEGLHRYKCTNCKSCLDYMTAEDEQLILKCFRCKKNYERL